MADDVADVVAFSDRLDADGGGPACASARASRRRDRRHPRSSPPASVLGRLDAARRSAPERSHTHRGHRPLVAARADVRSLRRGRDERADMAGDRAGAGSAQRTAQCDFAEQRRVQPRPCHRSRHGRPDGRCVRVSHDRIRGGVSGQRAFIYRGAGRDLPLETDPALHQRPARRAPGGFHAVRPAVCPPRAAVAGHPFPRLLPDILCQRDVGAPRRGGAAGSSPGRDGIRNSQRLHRAGRGPRRPVASAPAAPACPPTRSSTQPSSCLPACCL